MMYLLTTLIVFLLSGITYITAQVLQNPESSYNRGIEAIRRNDFATARTELTKAVKDSATNAQAWHALAFVGMETRDYGLIGNAGKHISALEPARYEGWYFLALEYYERKVMDSLAIMARKVMAISPEKAREANLVDILQGLSQDSIGLRDSVFSTPDGTVRISLPASWSTRLIDDGKTLNWFISLEPVKTETDMFSTGVSIHWIRKVSESFKLDGQTDAPFLVGFWAGYSENMPNTIHPFYRKQLDTIAIERGEEWWGRIVMEDRQLTADSHKLRKYGAIIARKDELFLCSMECPMENWPLYEDRFKKAFESIVFPN
ncbi:MAG: hypothetical protein J0I17_06265 ['Candidatus Kapabacteria' thiocyanatum]|uniref:Tetratricopeptide repeat protein n=1 Tax=Candidatus Kapaibacterium thiocyanatum TaxID=1895771 RepID=A0A1M3L6I5_9BACT|nr:hypothetical protein ['Candidatus Kapabacteria' thiocyanatum]OJX61178.1 MAG: hypothetical protein BGO89_00890 ['Candidatus Kapabacteria' thiocyanatum]